MQGHKHGKLLVDAAIKENGIENFKFEVIEKCKTVKELNEREKFWIEKLNCKQPNGYNVAEGGGGFNCQISHEITNSKFVEKMIKSNFIDDDMTIDYISVIMMAIDLFGNKKTKVLKYILENIDIHNNVLIATVNEISKNAGVSKKIVMDTLQILEEEQFITRKTGCIFVNINY